MIRTAAALMLSLALPAMAACPAKPELEALKTTQFKAKPAPAFALSVLDCLGALDPVLRDELGFEALQAWLRGGAIATADVQAMRARLLAMLDAPDDKGFQRPFAALALAEVARVDRVAPYLDAAQRQQLVERAARFVREVRDYRGYVEGEGWRHGVAHGADWLLQLALNPALNAEQATLVLDAVASQVNQTRHAYVFGEGERLMAPVFYLARRDVVSDKVWDAWFNTLMVANKNSDTAPGLVRRHNLGGFLYPLYTNLRETKDEPQRARLLPLVTRSLKQLD